MEVLVVVVLLIVGIALMLVELFLIPGLSVAGIASLLFLGGSVYYAYSFIGDTAGHLTLLGSVVFTAIGIWIFLKSRALERMSLKTNIDSKNDPLSGIQIEVGDEGVSSSRLAPMGKVKINGQIVEAKAVDDFIDQNTEVVVKQVFTTNVLVERKHK